MKLGWKGALGIVLSVACIYLAFRNIQWAEALRAARNANYGLLILSVIAATGMFVLRAWRWRVILDPVAPSVPFGPLWRSIAIGQMMTNLLPARSGEIVRPYALSREVPTIPFSMSLASVAVDRVFDAIVVLLLLGVSMLSPGLPTTLSVAGKTLTLSQVVRYLGIVPLALLICLYALVFFPDRLIRLFESFARPVSRALETKGSQMLRRFADGLSVLRNPKHFVAVFLWTLAHWLLQPLAFWLALQAFGIHVPWEATLFVQGVIVAAVALIPSPGFFGVFEAAGAAGLAAYGVDGTLGTTWALVFHVATFIPITLIGAFYFARAGISMGDMRAARNSDS
ncbi:MAG TPA: lysylphosphatidylglycerol synthase transmembrane domain-containing protein [Gemmatimonadaceae bacterium]|jgi:hypothetical protein